MHESSAFFCSAFDRKRHFKPEVTGRRLRAPRCSAIPRHCQQGRINKIKGPAAKAVRDFQAGKEHVLALPSQGSQGLLWLPPPNPNHAAYTRSGSLAFALQSRQPDGSQGGKKNQKIREERGAQGWGG